MKRSGYYSMFIVYFDVEMNQFKDLPTPDNLKSAHQETRPHYCLTVLYGCLCISEAKFSFQDIDNDVYIMEEYGVKRSWTKLFTIRGNLVPFQPTISPDVVLVISPNKEVGSRELDQDDENVINFGVQTKGDDSLMEISAQEYQRSLTLGAQ
ncbi:OLC1v1025476C1 [Oldenlandia corymbosa var. corymbosa]|uniref:OLC1v1025476C1 n=1 Tax=Oldenlandia corymbosa var. corymbosa TaxID=529605 RepID=A0AAV1C4Y0_OLDCO|nr:OLC1v1025476C1 [Oldenlandia corymbosa var. corymbosa]